GHPDHALSVAPDGAGSPRAARRQLQPGQRWRRHVPGPREPGLRHHEDRQARGPLPRRRRLYLQVTGTGTMPDVLTTNPPAAGASRRTRLLAASALVLAAALATGCARRDSITVGAVPDDYRTNHPIVVAERDKSVDI